LLSQVVHSLHGLQVQPQRELGIVRSNAVEQLNKGLEDLLLSDFGRSGQLFDFFLLFDSSRRFALALLVGGLVLGSNGFRTRQVDLLFEFGVDHASVHDRGEADQREEQGRHGELHTLLAAFDENAFEFGQEFEVHVCFILVVHQVDQL
jgi:hypothetical protein